MNQRSTLDLSVLVVEDDDAHRSHLSSALDQMGVREVLVASTGAQAMALALERERPVDVVVCTLMMHRTDGVDVLRQVARDRLARRVVLVSSAERILTQSVVRVATGFGFDVMGALPRPVDPSELRRLLASIGSRRVLVPTPARCGPLQRPLPEIDAALQAGEIRPLFQPIVSLSSGRLVGVEALARWFHPTDGLLPPSAFVTQLEVSGRERALFEVMLDAALAFARRRMATGRPLRVSVNASASTLAATDLPTLFRGRLLHFGVPAGMVTVELTETSLGDTGGLLETLSRLRLAGIRVALDDFGTGYATMSQLDQLPVNELKVDRGFVAGVDDDPRKRAIVRSVASLAEDLGISVVAEGVQTPGELAALRAIGCELGQGFFIAQPCGEAGVDSLGDRVALP